MARLTITEAARVAGVSRVTLHRHIKDGRLSRSADGTIDTAELLRAGFTLHPVTVTPPVTVQRDVTPPVTPAETPALERLVEVLQRELDAARDRERAAQEREALLLHMLEQVQQQNQRLLEVGRGPAMPALASQTTAGPREDRGAMRRHILELLHAHPEGLSPAEVRAHLDVTKPLANTLVAMARDGLLRRVERGRYVVAGLDHRIGHLA